MKNKIDIDILLNENGYSYGKSPWDFLIEEAKTQEVNSDDDTPPDDTPPDDTPKGSVVNGEGVPEEPKLTEEDLQQLIKELQQSQDMEADIKELLDNGSINQADVEIIGQALQGSENPQEPTPEDERNFQINNIQEMVIRFNIYDKLNDLEGKLEIFTDNFPNIDEDFYKDVAQIHEYIKVVNTLIFNLEINLVYQLFANLEMKLISLFQDYKEKREQENQIKG